MSKLICQICQREFLSLVGHVSRKHNLSSLEYQKQFPDSVMVIISDQQRENISKSHWSKKPVDETKHIRETLSRLGSEKFKRMNAEGKAFRMYKGFWSEEHKEYMSNVMTGRSVTWNDKIRESHWTKKSENEVREILERIIANGTYRNTKHGWFHSEKMNDDFFFMSSYEERRMKFLENSDEVKSFTGKHNVWIDYVWNDANHRYYPDLFVEFVDGTFRFEEIKGFILDDERTSLKEKACIEFVKSKNWSYKMIFEAELEIL